MHQNCSEMYCLTDFVMTNYMTKKCINANYIYKMLSYNHEKLLQENAVFIRIQAIFYKNWTFIIKYCKQVRFPSIPFP